VISRASYLHLGQVWLDAAQKLDGLPATAAASTTDERKKAGYVMPALLKRESEEDWGV
jgi:hypothetical protein